MIGWKKKTRKLIVLYLILLLFFIHNPIFVQATPTCAFGSFDAWMSLDGKSFMNTTVDNISLSCGQPFFVKVQVKPNQDHIWIALYLFEPGTRSEEKTSFEVISGPCELNAVFDLGECNENEENTFIWKLKVKDDPCWVGGFTPLSINACFQKKDYSDWMTDDISFSIALIHLNEHVYSEPIHSLACRDSFSAEDNVQLSSISSLFIFLFFILLVIIILKFKRK